MPDGSLLPVAVRGYTVRRKEADHADSARRGQWTPPHRVLVFDTETTTDRSQRLNFGSWRYYRLSWGADGPPEMACVEEGLFYADDLPERYPTGYQALLDYPASHGPAVSREVPEAAWRLELVSAREFVNEVLHPLASRGRTWVVGFNLPFDLSRIAYHYSESRDYLAGGFSLTLREYLTKQGVWREHQWRSRAAIKTIDSKRHQMGFKRPAEVDVADQVPEGEYEPAPGYTFRGHFLDLRTLAFALTNESYSLERACEEFGVAAGKTKAEAHGSIDRRYIDYNRRDVSATAGLFARLLAGHRRHPIKLKPTKASRRRVSARPICGRWASAHGSSISPTSHPRCLDGAWSPTTAVAPSAGSVALPSRWSTSTFCRCIRRSTASWVSGISLRPTV